MWYCVAIDKSPQTTPKHEYRALRECNMTPRPLTWHTIGAMGTRKECAMSDEQEFPNDGYILEHWFSSARAANIMGIDPGHVRFLAGEDKIRAKKILGRWLIDPDAAYRYKKYQHKRGNDDKS